jgi:hypothetical protein
MAKRKINIFPKNREILTMKKKTARFTFPQVAIERTKQDRTNKKHPAV